MGFNGFLMGFNGFLMEWNGIIIHLMGDIPSGNLLQFAIEAMERLESSLICVKMVMFQFANC